MIKRREFGKRSGRRLRPLPGASSRNRTRQQTEEEFDDAWAVIITASRAGQTPTDRQGKPDYNSATESST
jgi:hypothetical protein